MKPSKRRWTWGEKGLFLVPLVLMAGAGTARWRQVNEPRFIQTVGKERIIDCRFSPDGKRFLILRSSPLGQPAPRIEIYYTASLLKVVDLVPPAGLPIQQLRAPDWSPDGKRIVCGYSDGSVNKARSVISPLKTKEFILNQKIAVWDAKTGAVLAQWPYAPDSEDSIADVSFSKNGRWLLGRGRPPAVFDAKSGKRLRAFNSTATLGTVRVGMNGTFNAAANLVAVDTKDSPAIKVYDAQNGRVLGSAAAKIVQKMQWTRGEILAYSEVEANSTDHRIHLWHAGTKKFLPAVPTKQAVNFDLHPRLPWLAYTEADPKTIATPTLPMGKDRLVLWDFQNQRPIWSHELYGQSRQISWSPDGMRLAVRDIGDYDNFVWILNRRGEARSFKTKHLITGLRWSPDSKELAVLQAGGLEIMNIAAKGFPTL
ncbi:WD40 repeat domain-containing protein [bacterium]|nr:MAG: WD40 repeat domain-containing protein [bacterium]